VPAADAAADLGQVVGVAHPRPVLADGEEPVDAPVGQGMGPDPLAPSPGLEAVDRPHRAGLGHAPPAGDPLEHRRRRLRPQQPAHGAVDAVGPDQQVGGRLARPVRRPVGDGDLPAGVPDPGDLGAGAHAAGRELVQQHPLELGPVVGQQRRVPSGPEAHQVAARGGQQVGGRLGRHRARPEGLAEAERVRGPLAVARERPAGAGRPQLGRPLQHGDRPADPAQHDGGGESADAAADHDRRPAPGRAGLDRSLPPCAVVVHAVHASLPSMAAPRVGAVAGTLGRRTGAGHRPKGGAGGGIPGRCGKAGGVAQGAILR
jgi:hypothetical protein